ncbi:MAG: hypothetical protein MR291_00530 [Oscillospiraceae bacterium]|nr:hypothetical protein [Oscillospiraceae bacterium]
MTEKEKLTEELRRLLEKRSAGDIRRALELVRTFFELLDENRGQIPSDISKSRSTDSFRR